MGLVHEVVPAVLLEAHVTRYANTVAENAPLTLAAIKRAYLELEIDPGQRNMGAAQAMIDACFESSDYHEGRDAFAQKRPPRFTGR